MRCEMLLAAGSGALRGCRQVRRDPASLNLAALGHADAIDVLAA